MLALLQVEEVLEKHSNLDSEEEVDVSLVFLTEVGVEEVWIIFSTGVLLVGAEVGVEHLEPWVDGEAEVAEVELGAFQLSVSCVREANFFVNLLYSPLCFPYLSVEEVALNVFLEKSFASLLVVLRPGFARSSVMIFVDWFSIWVFQQIRLLLLLQMQKMYHEEER